MKKRWGILDEYDFFFNKKLQPLLDKAKLRKFKPSYIMIGSIALIGAYLPYKYYFVYAESITIMSKNRSQLTIIMSSHPLNNDQVNINKSFILPFLHHLLLILFRLLLLHLHYLLFLLLWHIPHEQILTYPRVI